MKHQLKPQDTPALLKVGSGQIHEKLVLRTHFPHCKTAALPTEKVRPLEPGGMTTRGSSKRTGCRGAFYAQVLSYCSWSHNASTPQLVQVFISGLSGEEGAWRFWRGQKALEPCLGPPQVTLAASRALAEMGLKRDTQAMCQTQAWHWPSSSSQRLPGPAAPGAWCTHMTEWVSGGFCPT